jgi:thioredoxin 1
MPSELNRDNYEQEMLQSKGVLLVEFWGPQCVPCLRLMPAVEQLEKEYGGKLKVTKVNAAQNRMLCAKLRVMSLPTFIVYKDANELTRLVGEKVAVPDLISAIENALQ